ncbi:jg4623 [Pararge aegeria aegeria]|uniref:Jg4623 protein n=1 Tax=Pararge aegeria aegeria TaxID=348720 RepID=A0A8S4QKN2_9NEOP|nr:jg4623 [Pararge aegeria aegeria]
MTARASVTARAFMAARASMGSRTASDPAVTPRWAQMKLFNRHLAGGERIEYMGWVHEGLVSGAQPWQTYRPRFLVLKGTDVMLFDVPPVRILRLVFVGLMVLLIYERNRRLNFLSKMGSSRIKS